MKIKSGYGLALIAGLILSGCGGDDNNATSASTSAAGSGSAVASGTATGAAGSFLSQVFSVVSSRSDTAEPTSVDGVNASVDATASPTQTQ